MGDPGKTVVLNENPSQKDMDNAKASLLEMAKNTAWLEDPKMFKVGQWGLTNCGLPEEDSYFVVVGALSISIQSLIYLGFSSSE